MDFSRFALCAARKQEEVGPSGQMSSRRGRTQAQHASGREVPWIRAVLGTLSTVQELSADQPLRHPQETHKGPRRPAPEQAGRLGALAAAALSLKLRALVLLPVLQPLCSLAAEGSLCGPWVEMGREERGSISAPERGEGAGSLELT